MKQHGEGHLELELSELIEINRLVRGGINMAGFLSWYHAISVDEQSSLLMHLHLFAQQSGYDQQIWQRAVNQAGQTEEDLIVRHAASFRNSYSRELGDEEEWLSQLEAPERLRLLSLFVYLFGYAEGRVFTQEREEFCNHWWHRDLMDERVVRAILADPNYWNTSMKHDHAIKQQGKLRAMVEWKRKTR